MVYLFWVKIEAILHTILQISQIHLIVRISKTLGSTATKRKCFHFASIILRNKKKMHVARKWKICNNDNERY